MSLVAKLVLAAALAVCARPTEAVAAAADGGAQYFYWTYSTGCDGGGISGIRGLVVDEETEFVGGSGPTCPSEMACLYAPSSSACTSLDPVGEALSDTTLYSNGTLSECDAVVVDGIPGGPDGSLVFCGAYEPGQCTVSDGGYPACGYAYLPEEALHDPTLLGNADEADQLTDYYYIAYYQDEICTEPVGIRAFVSGEEISLLRTGEDVSCRDAMACLYNPGGPSCQERRGGADSPLGEVNATFYTSVTDSSVVSSCDGTLAKIEGSCVDETPDQCVQSGVFAGEPCMFRIVSASYVALNPGILVAEGADPTTGGGGGSDDTTTTSSGAPVEILKSLQFLLLLLSAVHIY